MKLSYQHPSDCIPIDPRPARHVDEIRASGGGETLSSPRISNDGELQVGEPQVDKLASLFRIDQKTRQRIDLFR
jgi:hypothetical protein